MFIKRLKEARQEKKLTQAEMANLLNISKTGYAGWEQGRTEPNLDMLSKLCKILNVSADYLIGLSEY
ncbi:MAG: helix-turn-helix transcriptional regulator [Clostridia bacterium]|nr:helix-turn-helix transcriptional regulator [Clostridia bacterium]